MKYKYIKLLFLLIIHMNNKCIYAHTASDDDVSQDQHISFIGDIDKLKEYIVDKMDLQDADSVIKDICAKLSFFHNQPLNFEELEYLLKRNSLKIPTKKLNQAEFINYICKEYLITDIDQLLECIKKYSIETDFNYNELDEDTKSRMLWVVNYKKMDKLKFINFIKKIRYRLKEELILIFKEQYENYEIRNIDELKGYLKFKHKVDNLNDILSTSKILKDTEVTEEKLSLILEIGAYFYPDEDSYQLSLNDQKDAETVIKDIVLFDKITAYHTAQIARYLFNKNTPYPNIAPINTSKTESLKEFFKQQVINNIYLIDILDCIPHDYNGMSIEEIYDELAQNILDKYISSVDQLKRYIVDKMNLQDADSVIKDIRAKLSFFHNQPLNFEELEYLLKRNSLKIPTKKLNQAEFINYICKEYLITDIDQLLECIKKYSIETDFNYNELDEYTKSFLLWAVNYKKIIKMGFIHYFSRNELKKLDTYLKTRYAVENIDELKSYLKIIYKVDNLNDVLSTSEFLKKMGVTEEKLSLILEINTCRDSLYLYLPKLTSADSVIKHIIEINRITDVDMLDKYAKYISDNSAVDISKNKDILSKICENNVIYLVEILNGVSKDQTSQEVYDKLSKNILTKYAGKFQRAKIWVRKFF